MQPAEARPRGQSNAGVRALASGHGPFTPLFGVGFCLGLLPLRRAWDRSSRVRRAAGVTCLRGDLARRPTACASLCNEFVRPTYSDRLRKKVLPLPGDAPPFPERALPVAARSWVSPASRQAIGGTAHIPDKSSSRAVPGEASSTQGIGRAAGPYFRCLADSTGKGSAPHRRCIPYASQSDPSGRRNPPNVWICWSEWRDSNSRPLPPEDRGYP